MTEYQLDSKMLELYWRFVAERRAMQLRRDAGAMPPWTTDDTLRWNRFTNVYRIEDRVSQYLVSNVLYNQEWSAEDLVFRAILFRIFNLPATWDFLVAEFGEPRWATFHHHWEQWADAVAARRESGIKVFNGAYLIAGVHTYHHLGKEHNWLYLLNHMMVNGVYGHVLAAPTYRDVYQALLRYEMVGPFLAMQWLTDINYSPAIAFSENEWVMPGHGAVRGLTKLGLIRQGDSGASGIEWLRERFQSSLAERNLRFDPLGGRRWPSLMDIQNSLCEYDKYARAVAPWVGNGPAKIKQRFDQFDAWTHRPPVDYRYPPKWAMEK